MTTIVQKKEPVLRKTAKSVEHFNASELATTIRKMAEALFAEPDGIGIAAPQIGISLQIFLVASDVLAPLLLEERLNEGKTKKSSKKPISPDQYIVFINPTFQKISKKKSVDIEGCLSVRGVYGEVTRPEKVTIDYYTETGEQKTRGASGLFARVLQHEMDHLEGTLFIDKAKHIQNIPQK